MQTIEKDFLTVTQKIGFGTLAKLANVAYQAVSNFANDPRPGHKYRVRRRILTTVIDQSELRVNALREEANELEKQITGFKQWRAQEFDN